MDVSPRDAASRILEATCVRVPVSSAGSSLQTSFRTARKRAARFGGEHEEYQQFGCVRYARPFELQWGIVVNVGNNRPRRTHQLLSLVARRRALVTLNSDHFLL